MNVKKLKSLDITRLIITIITIALACVILLGGMIVLFIQVTDTLADQAGSAFIMILAVILPAIWSFCLFLAGIFGLIRYFSSRKKDIQNRGFSGFGLAASILPFCGITLLQGLGIYAIIIGIISFVISVLYLICEIIEMVQCKKEKQILDTKKQLYVSQSKCCVCCGNNIDSDSKFCTHCGNMVDKVVKYCSQCGNKLDSDAKFCTRCGKSME